jgi:hypothetical protein
MLRDAIVLSDTDSTCGSYDYWVEWYYGNMRFSQEAIAIAAAVMTINTQVMDHNIKVFAKNMNIQDDLVELLKMKNEFFWDVFVATNVSKHYYARTITQEGNVYKEPIPEIKGVHLIASTVDQSITDQGNKMMNEIFEIATSGNKIDLKEFVTRVANIERSILDRIKNGDIDIYKKERIKDKDSYKLDEEDSPYFHHILWNSVFAEKYGSSGNPEYNVIRIPTILKTRKAFNTFIDNMEDRDIATKLKTVMDNAGKDNLGTIRLPIAIVGSIGVPEEIIPAIDFKRIILDNCNMLYTILESIGFYRKPDRLISELGY